ncbi:MAG: hypothetical protein LIR46_08175 [Bacteroidota bacterium]|nr:hypothetical protein [Bacteroidota bacterium]
MKKWLLETNYENLGESDAEEFEKDYNEIFDLAIKALEQESFKPMVEIDLYSVIKQSYIEREVLDKIRAEIEEERVHDDWDLGQEIYYNNAIDNVLQIIDKYKAKRDNA